MFDCRSRQSYHEVAVFAAFYFDLHLVRYSVTEERHLLRPSKRYCGWCNQWSPVQFYSYRY